MHDKQTHMKKCLHICLSKVLFSDGLVLGCLDFRRSDKKWRKILRKNSIVYFN